VSDVMRAGQHLCQTLTLQGRWTSAYSAENLCALSIAVSLSCSIFLLWNVSGCADSRT
jgi:hypothetical protein